MSPLHEGDLSVGRSEVVPRCPFFTHPPILLGLCFPTCHFTERDMGRYPATDLTYPRGRATPEVHMDIWPGGATSPPAVSCAVQRVTLVGAEDTSWTISKRKFSVQNGDSFSGHHTYARVCSGRN